MTLAVAYSRALCGIKAPLITIETHITNGFINLSIVGLLEAVMKESKHRVRSAIMNSHFEFPLRRITVNLAPADLPKEGARFDLAIALSILAASGQISKEALAEYEFIGELALSGAIRPVQGILPTVIAAREAKRALIIPSANQNEATLVGGAEAYAAKHILEVCAHLQGHARLPLCVPVKLLQKKSQLDLSDVKGQPHAKRALEIAAAGRHSLLLVGPPGTGKTMLAARLPSLLPALSEEQALEVATIASISRNGFDEASWKQVPYRAPHHTSSSAALVGGGRPPRPGEISLAHHGILFLDELPEFARNALECLREPLESGHICISRAQHQNTFPASFQLIAAMNPCPCGHAGSPLQQCECTPQQIKRYVQKISGPLLDRIDMQIEVPRLATMQLMNDEIIGETSQTVRERVMQAEKFQLARQGKVNALLSVKELERFAFVNADAKKILQQVLEKFNLSSRVYHRLIKLARTIADLQGKETICAEHVRETISFRTLDRRKY